MNLLTKLILIFFSFFSFFFLQQKNLFAQEITSFIIEAKAFALNEVDPEIKIWQAGKIIGTVILPADNDYQIYTINLSTPAKTDLRISLYLSNGEKTETTFRGIYIDRIQINNEWIEAEGERIRYRFNQTVQDDKPIKTDVDRTVFALEQASTFIVDPPLNPELSPFGVNLTTTYWFWEQAPEWSYAPRAKLLAEAGVRWGTVHIYQSDFDPQKGNANITKLDHYLKALADEGIILAGNLLMARSDLKDYDCYNEYYGPENDSNYPKNCDFSNGGDLYGPEGVRENWAVWENYVRFIVGRYGPKGQNLIHTWFIENEPDLSQSANKSPNPQSIYQEDEQLYLELIQKSYQYIKDPQTGEDPQALIVSSAMSELNLDNGQIVDRWLAAGLGNYFSVFAFNCYISDTSSAINLYNQVKTMLERYGQGSKPVWLRETNVGWTATNPEAKILEMKSRYHQMINSGVQKVFWFPEDASPEVTIYGWGILDEPDGRHTGTYIPNFLYESYQKMALNGFVAPASPVISEPENNAVFINSQQIKLSWQPITIGTYAVASYQIQIATESAFLNPLSSSQAATEYIINNPKVGNYYWRVKAIDQLGNHGRWSESRNFLVKVRSQADADDDGDVDLADLAIWINNFSKQTTQGQTEADFNQDTKVNALDFGVWLKNYSP